jgi:hypothetical protein
MKVYGVEAEIHAFLNFALHKGECSASRPGGFAPEKRLFF